MKKIFLAGICLMFSVVVMSQDLSFTLIKNFDKKSDFKLSTFYVNEPLFVFAQHNEIYEVHDVEIYDKNFVKILDFNSAGTIIYTYVREGKFEPASLFVTQTFFNDDDLFEFVCIEDNTITIRNEDNDLLGSVPLSNTGRFDFCDIYIVDNLMYMGIHYYESSQSNIEIYEIVREQGTNIVNFTDKNANAYPNPATTHIFIDNDDLLKGILNVFNEDGKLVKQQTVSSNNKIMVETTDLSPGLYIYCIQEGNSINQSGKFIIQ